MQLAVYRVWIMGPILRPKSSGYTKGVEVRFSG
jgi:hypothetical protein